ncbi:MAG: CHAD domain-containing protein [Bryobacteraceae bacterium]
MDEFALAQVEMRLARVRTELGRTLSDPSEDPVHDLRVSIRRLQQALRLFGEVYGIARTRMLKQRLAPVLKAAGGVRDGDIAMMLLAESGCADVLELREEMRRKRARDTGVLRLRILQAGSV